MTRNRKEPEYTVETERLFDVLALDADAVKQVLEDLLNHLNLYVACSSHKRDGEVYQQDFSVHPWGDQS